MLAKCANPSCSTPLVYLREGKIFMVESPQQQFELLSADPTKPKATHRVEHFWLCGPCSGDMTSRMIASAALKLFAKQSVKRPLCVALPPPESHP